MRWRVGVVLCFFAVYFGIGCREPLKPNIDRNQAPETWITAAPFDTITIRDSHGNPIGDPTPGTIPVRFHVYWAGADNDGAVAGFYWAVVETLPRPTPGQGLPTLPGPKPQDYHFTTRTDSFFVFSVAEDIPDRQHAFFIYAVDNQGKPDPTPARFIFNAQDRFPPIPIFDRCSCVGTVYAFNGAGVLVARPDSAVITDHADRFTAPRDTCASNSTITFRWHGEPQVPQVTVTGYRYKLDEPQFVEVGPEVLRKQYLTYIGGDTIPPASGEKIFTLRVVDQAFGTRDSTRRLQYNYSPDTWLAGPDPNDPLAGYQTTPRGEKYILLNGGQLPAGGIHGSLLSPDSTLVLPALRPEEKHFFEIWKDTVFVRSDGDTVHMNSWVLFHSGGFDRDSRYRVAVSSLARQLPGFPGGIVLDPAGPNGSPVSFRLQVLTQLYPSNALGINAISNPYPIFDPNDVFNNPRIGGYQPMIQSGKAYAYTFALDGDNSPDRRIGVGATGSIDPVTLVTKDANGTASDYERGLRQKVLSFYVDKAPYLVMNNPTFTPTPGHVFTSQFWDLHLWADDEDPFIKQSTPGGPSATKTLRRRITVIGTDKNDGGRIEELDPIVYLNQSDISITAPVNLAPGPATLRVEICDCDQCEDFPGSGRCRTVDIPVVYNPVAPASPTSSQSSTNRPGNGDSPMRSKRP
jgi:hypothetical protein